MPICASQSEVDSGATRVTAWTCPVIAGRGCTVAWCAAAVIGEGRRECRHRGGGGRGDQVRCDSGGSCAVDHVARACPPSEYPRVRYALNDISSRTRVPPASLDTSTRSQTSFI